jgi:hypothetical protein
VKGKLIAMELDDYLEPEVAITAAVTAAVFSPQARKLIRRGAVYGVAGALIASDAVVSFAKSIGQGFQLSGTNGAGTSASHEPQQQTHKHEHASPVGSAGGQD